MQFILYYISLFFIYLVALIPFPFIYGVSDFLFILIYYIVGYRKKVVIENLRKSFPEKSEEEIKKITKRFYHYLCDLFIETFKTLTFSENAAKKHCSMHPKAQALFDRYHAEGKSIILVMGHYGNWEWAGSTFSLLCKQQLYVIYHPLANKHFNGLICKMRSLFGTKLYAMKDAFKDMMNNKTEISATAFIADQTPPPESAYWTKFLNQQTPVFWGTEKIARKLNYPVVYVSMKLKKRGYYELHAETLFENPKECTVGEISEAHTRRLEADIVQQPELWLWSHRRWKHKAPLVEKLRS